MIDYRYNFPEHENNKDIFGEQNNYNVFIDASGFTYLGTYEKDKRKYIGIVFQINGMNYFAPLSSYKTKHVKMKESVDFIKIKDYAVINLNNMIPVPNSQIVEIDINKEKDLSYRYLLQAESREINRQKNRIRKNAEIVYSHKIHNGDSTALAKRINDFELLEKLCREY